MVSLYTTVWVLLVTCTACYAADDQCTEIFQTHRQCLSDGEFEFDCNGRIPAVVRIEAARLLRSRDAGSCDTSDDVVCEVSGDVTEQQEIDDCFRHNCTISSLPGVVDTSTCTAQGYQGEDILEITYTCSPSFTDHEMGKAMTLCNNDPEWVGQILQVDGRELGGLLFLPDQDISDRLMRAITVREPNCSCAISVEPNTEVYIRIQAFGVFHADSYIPAPCEQRMMVWDGPGNRVGEFCVGDTKRITLPCVDRTRELETYLVNDAPDDVRIAIAFHIAVSHHGQMRAVCGQLRNEYTTAAPETTEAPTTEAPTTEVPTTEPPTTEAPTTEPPTTEAPTTEPPEAHTTVENKAPTTVDDTGNNDGTTADDGNFVGGDSTTIASGNNSSTGKLDDEWILVILVICCGVALLLLMIAIFIVCMRRRRDREAEKDDMSESSGSMRHITEVYVDGDMKSRLFTVNKGFTSNMSAMSSNKQTNLYR